jgi:hypothetical protein
LAALISICLINLRQAQVENSINLNMSAQTILTKLSKSNTVVNATNGTIAKSKSQIFNQFKNEHETHFKEIFDYVNY